MIVQIPGESLAKLVINRSAVLMKRVFFVCAWLLILTAGLSVTQAQDETVFGGLPRSETFIVASQAPNIAIWDVHNFWQNTTFNNAGGYTQLSVEVPFIEWGGEVWPWLAQSWEYNEDGTQMTLNITEGVNWSDGTPMTIEDWTFTLEYAKENAGRGILFAQFLSEVEWTTEGDNQIIFTLPESNFRFHQAFIADISMSFTPVPKHIWEGQDPVTFTNPTAVGTGPYTLQSCNNDTQTCIWERRDDYWNAEAMPAPKYQVWLRRPEPDVAVFEWEAGNYDLGRMPGQLTMRLMSTNSNLSPLIHQDPCPRGLVFNVERPPLDDPQFRHALSLLLDRQKVANLASVPGYVATVPWPYSGEPSTNFYDPEAAAGYDATAFDPAKAAEILDAAGYALVDGKRVDHDGNPIVLSASYIDVGNPGWTTWSWLLAEQAGLVGIEINPTLHEIPTFFTIGPEGNFDIMFRWFCVRPSDPLAAYVGLSSELYKPIGEASGGIPGRYTSDEMDALIEQMSNGDPSSPEIAEVYRQAYELLIKDKPYIMMYGENEAVFTNTQYWTGLAVGQPWVHWGNHFRQQLTYITATE
jgi:peptide/nickel transport system substrate-binding protein